jgi:hypothetical protein
VPRTRSPSDGEHRLGVDGQERLLELSRVPEGDEVLDEVRGAEVRHRRLPQEEAARLDGPRELGSVHLELATELVDPIHHVGRVCKVREAAGVGNLCWRSP